MTSTVLQRRHLEAFVAIADAGSVHAAARELGLAQPALSRLLAETERLLGGRLFDRSSQGSQPTAEGRALLTRARSVLRGLERLGEADARVRAPIRLGCIARAMHTLMPALLERVYPGADDASGAPRFRLMEGSSAMLLDAVSSGRIDFAILRSTGTFPAEADLIVERLYDERTVIIGAGRVRHAGPLTLQRLAALDWVLPDRQTGSRAAFDRFWVEQGLTPVQPLVETRSFETSLALVAKTRFLSIAPESIARLHAARGDVSILRTRRALPTSPVTLVYARGATEDATLVDFRAALRSAARQARATIRARLS